jgi:hypothetical protein
MKRSALKPTDSLQPDPQKVRDWQQRNRERQRKRVRFVAKRPARTQKCFRCGARAAHWHHWLPQQAIRVYAAYDRTVRWLTEDEHRLLLRRLLRDERNLSPVCAPCHMTTKAGRDAFTAAEVPARAREFAAELGAEWAEKLGRRYR